MSSHWYKDYGAPVKTGDVLATIDTPALDAQFAASKANLAVTQARYKLADMTAKRWSALAGDAGGVAAGRRREGGGRRRAEGQVDAAQQNVARYQALIAFKQLVAPFDGVVTAATSTSATTSTPPAAMRRSAVPRQPLFIVADIHQDADLRVGAAGICRCPEAGPDRDADIAAGAGQADHRRSS